MVTRVNIVTVVTLVTILTIVTKVTIATIVTIYIYYIYRSCHTMAGGQIDGGPVSRFFTWVVFSPFLCF